MWILSYLLFLKLKICLDSLLLMDQSCHKKVNYLAEMVQYGTKNSEVQQDARKEEILLLLQNQALSDLYEYLAM